MSAVDMAVALAREVTAPAPRADGASRLLDLLPDLTHADTTQEAGLISRPGSLPDLSLTPLRPYQTKPLSRRHPAPEPDPASPITPAAATRTQKRARYLGPLPPPSAAARALFAEGPPGLLSEATRSLTRRHGRGSGYNVIRGVEPLPSLGPQRLTFSDVLQGELRPVASSPVQHARRAGRLAEPEVPREVLGEALGEALGEVPPMPSDEEQQGKRAPSEEEAQPRGAPRGTHGWVPLLLSTKDRWSTAHSGSCSRCRQA